jgi:hypothetical protein
MKNLTRKVALELVLSKIPSLPFGNINTKAKMGKTASLAIINHSDKVHVLVRKKTYETHLLEREDWRTSEQRLSRYQLRVVTKTTEVLVFYWNGTDLEQKEYVDLLYKDCPNTEVLKKLKQKQLLSTDPNGLPWNVSTHGGGMKDF